MIIASSYLPRPDGARVLFMIVGLSDENIHHMRDGQSLVVDGGRVGEPALRVVMVAGRTDMQLGRDIMRSTPEILRAANDVAPNEIVTDALGRILHDAGARITYLPSPDEAGQWACADCGERIVADLAGERPLLVHGASGEHLCAFGTGCAHVAEIDPVPPTVIRYPAPQPKGEQ